MAGHSRPALIIRRVFLALTALVVVVLVVVGFAVWSATGGTAYDAEDWTVRNARKAADVQARAAVDRVSADLSPTLGAPTGRGMVDTCYESSQIFVNGLTCQRSQLLYYPITGEVPHAIDVARPIPTSRWPSADYRSCRWATGVTRDCRETSKAKLVVQVDSATADVNERLPQVTNSMYVVEQNGFSELTRAVTSGPCIVVAYTTTYFSD